MSGRGRRRPSLMLFKEGDLLRCAVLDDLKLFFCEALHGLAVFVGDYDIDEHVVDGLADGHA